MTKVLFAAVCPGCEGDPVLQDHCGDCGETGIIPDPGIRYYSEIRTAKADDGSDVEVQAALRTNGHIMLGMRTPETLQVWEVNDNEWQAMRAAAFHLTVLQAIEHQ